MLFAENGILEMGNRMPAHLSLYNLLKYNGYHSSFYYGGDTQFDMSFNNFKTKNNKITKGGKLLPDSIIEAYKLR